MTKYPKAVFPLLSNGKVCYSLHVNLKLHSAITMGNTSSLPVEVLFLSPLSAFQSELSGAIQPLCPPPLAPPSLPPCPPETWPAQCPAFWFRPTGPGNVNFMGSLGKSQIPRCVFIINCYFRKTQDNRSTGIRGKKEHPGRAFIQGRSVQAGAQNAGLSKCRHISCFFMLLRFWKPTHAFFFPLWSWLHSL